MRNRKRIIVSFMIVACMLMAVGFAALTDDLWINGDAKLSHGAANDEVAKDVYFSAVKDENNCSAVISSADSSSDTIVVKINDDTTTMAVTGDSATFTATVKNDNNVQVWLTFRHTASAYFEMCIVDENGVHTTGEDGSITVAANGGETDIFVYVKMLQNVPTAGIEDTAFNIEVTASTVDPSAP